MWKLIRKMFVDIVFVTVLYLVSYSNLDSNAILQVQHLRHFFLNTPNLTYDYTEIISINDYWNWLQYSFVPNIRVQSWYNGDLAENMTYYINDKTTLLIGWGTMRQLRLRLKASCTVPSILRPLIDACKGSYSIFSDERRSFAPGWVLSTNVSYSSSIENAFIYRSSTELDSYIYVSDHGTYGGGGYVYNFDGDLNDLEKNLTLLRQLSWIDDESRAVMIQLNLYNPNVQFFISVTLLAEIFITGEVFSSARIEPTQIYTEFNSFSSIFYLIIAFIYIIFIIYFTTIEINSILKIKQKYFHQLRSYIEWGIIDCSWAGVVIYIWRYQQARRIGKYFRQTNGLQYINLQLATYVNDILTFLLGFVCFFSTIRLVRLFDIYPHIYVFSKTLRRAFNDIVAFSFMFFLVFFAFAILFYLLFVSKMFSCSSLLQTCGMLFEMILLKFDFAEIQNADAFLSPFVFVLFIYFMVFICITMFVAIITTHLRDTRKRMLTTRSNHPGIISFIIQDIMKRIGWKKLIKHLPDERDVVVRSQCKTPVEQLPEKIEELLLAFQKLFSTYPESEVRSVLQSNEISNSNFYLQRKCQKKRRVIY